MNLFSSALHSVGNTFATLVFSHHACGNRWAQRKLANEKEMLGELRHTNFAHLAEANNVAEQLDSQYASLEAYARFYKDSLDEIKRSDRAAFVAATVTSFSLTLFSFNALLHLSSEDTWTSTISHTLSMGLFGQIANQLLQPCSAKWLSLTNPTP